MTHLRVVVSRLLDVVLRRRRDDRLTEEVEAHLDLLAAEFMQRGMSPGDARAAARRAFGGVDQVKEEYRDQRGLPSLDTLLQDLRLAVRLLWRAPGFAATAVAVLGIGIGVNNMLFTIVNAHAIRGLPIPDADRVVYATTFDERTPNLGVSFADFTDWQQRARSVDALIAFTNAPIVVTGDGQAPVSFAGTYVSFGAFALVSTQPILGRDFTAQDDSAGAGPVVILGTGVWESRYGRDTGVLGRTITVNGAPAVIIGVMSDRSGFPSTAEVWLPLSQFPGLREQPRSTRSLRVIGHMRQGTDLAGVGAELDTISGQLAAEHPTTNARVRSRVMPINEQFAGSYTNPAWLAFMAVGVLVVLISCANAANLMLARALNRTREIAVRTALGASRLRIVRQLCIEGATLAFLGGLLGLVLALGGVRLFRAAMPADALPYWIDYTIDGRVLSALILVSVATVFLFALIPAMHASRPDLNSVLKEGGRPVTGYRGRRWTTGFLAAEFGMAVVLLAHFVATIRTGAPELPSDAALRTTEIVTAEITLPRARYDTPERRAAFYGLLSERLGAVRTLSSVTVASALPLLGGEPLQLDIMGRPTRDKEQRQIAMTLGIAPGYFSTLGLPLVRGRDFTAEDGTAGREFAIVNERFVERFFADRNPLGERIAVSPSGSTTTPQWLTIAGVSPDIRQRPWADADAAVYLPLRSQPKANAVLVVRSTMPTEAVTALLRGEMQSLDGTLPLHRVRTMAQAARDAEWVGRISRNLAMFLTFVAVILATLGLYAVTSYMVSQRTQEIGMRMALGARTRQVVWFVARQIAVQLAAGLATGIVLTKVWGALFSSGQAGVSVTDLGSLLAVAAILIVIATIACFVPVRRAIRLDPVAAIRHG